MKNPRKSIKSGKTRRLESEVEFLYLERGVGIKFVERALFIHTEIDIIFFGVSFPQMRNEKEKNRYC